jgi:hypothetical protein
MKCITASKLVIFYEVKLRKFTGNFFYKVFFFFLTATILVATALRDQPHKPKNQYENLCYFLFSPRHISFISPFYLTLSTSPSLLTHSTTGIPIGYDGTTSGTQFGNNVTVQGVIVPPYKVEQRGREGDGGRERTVGEKGGRKTEHENLKLILNSSYLLTP